MTDRTEAERLAEARAEIDLELRTFGEPKKLRGIGRYEAVLFMRAFDAATREAETLREEVGRLWQMLPKEQRDALDLKDKIAAGYRRVAQAPNQSATQLGRLVEDDASAYMDHLAREAPAQPTIDDVPDDPDPRPYHQRQDYPDPGPALKRALKRSTRLIAEGQPTTDDVARAREIAKQYIAWDAGHGANRQESLARNITFALTAARAQGEAKGRAEQQALDADVVPLDQCPACHWHPGHEPEEWFREEAVLRGFTTPRSGADGAG